MPSRAMPLPVTDVQIRPGCATDLPQILALQEHSLRALCIQEYSTQQIQALVTDQAQHRHGFAEVVLLAEVADKLVGFASLEMGGQRIAALYVHPDWARRGIATRLIAHLEGMARQSQVCVLKVCASLTAIPFYKQQGFQTLRDTGFWASGNAWIPCREMVKPLASRPHSSVVKFQQKPQPTLTSTQVTPARSQFYDTRALGMFIATLLALGSLISVYRSAPQKQSQPQSQSQVLPIHISCLYT
jgi:putative acetyltransferase